MAPVSKIFNKDFLKGVTATLIILLLVILILKPWNIIVYVNLTTGQQKKQVDFLGYSFSPEYSENEISQWVSKNKIDESIYVPDYWVIESSFYGYPILRNNIDVSRYETPLELIYNLPDAKRQVILKEYLMSYANYYKSKKDQFDLMKEWVVRLLDEIRTAR